MLHAADVAAAARRTGGSLSGSNASLWGLNVCEASKKQFVRARHAGAHLAVAVVQNLKSLAVQRVRVRVLGELILDPSDDCILVVIEPRCRVGAGGGVDELVATVWDNLGALHALVDA